MCSVEYLLEIPILALSDGQVSPGLSSWSPLSKESGSIVILLSINTECVFLTGIFPPDPQATPSPVPSPAQDTARIPPVVVVEQGLGEENVRSLEGRNYQPRNTD